MMCDNCFRFPVCRFDDAPDECQYFLSNDLVEVVRCKDCKHCEHINDEFAKDWYQCKRRGNFAQKKPNDYCSYGERRC